MGLEAQTRLSSNYRKHTAANPLQRALIDRFHRKIVAEVWHSRRKRSSTPAAARALLPAGSSTRLRVSV